MKEQVEVFDGEREHSQRIPTSWSRLRPRDRLLVAIAPLLLVVVAVNQHVLAATEKLDPWKGGGFGMFATVDSGTAREVFAYGITREGFIINDQSEPGLGRLVTPAGLIRRAAALPDDATLRKIGMKSLTSYQDSGESKVGRENLIGVRIEVVTIDYDSSTREVRYVVLRSLDVFQS